MKTKKLLTFLIVFALLGSLLPPTAMAVEPITIDVSSAAAGTYSGYTCTTMLVNTKTEFLVTITTPGDYVLTGTVMQDAHPTHVIVSASQANITLNNVNMTLLNFSPLAIKPGSSANLSLATGTVNTLSLGNSEVSLAGLSVPADASLVINGTGKLIARGGSAGNGAGIGGGFNQFTSDSTANRTAGSITINSGVIEASGGPEGAGIGCAPSGNGGIITINGGKVTATGSKSSESNAGAGIGGGCFGNGSITITGGTVIAQGGNNDAEAIGSGSLGSSASTVKILGGSVKTLSPMRIRSTPKNNSANVYLTTVTVQDGGSPLSSTELFCRLGAASFTAKTDGDGKLYLWLPAGGNTIVVSTGSAMYRAVGTVLTDDATVLSTVEFNPCVEVNGTMYETWAEATTAVQADQSITLLKDVALSSSDQMPAVACTIDGGAGKHKLTLDGQNLRADMTLKDLTLKSTAALDCDGNHLRIVGTVGAEDDVSFANGSQLIIDGNLDIGEYGEIKGFSFLSVSSGVSVRAFKLKATSAAVDGTVTCKYFNLGNASGSPGLLSGSGQLVFSDAGGEGGNIVVAANATILGTARITLGASGYTPADGQILVEAANGNLDRFVLGSGYEGFRLKYEASKGYILKTVTPLRTPSVSLAPYPENGGLTYTITPAADETGTVSGYMIQLLSSDGTTEVGTAIAGSATSGTVPLSGAVLSGSSYRAKVKAIAEADSDYTDSSYSAACAAVQAAPSDAAIVDTAKAKAESALYDNILQSVASSETSIKESLKSNAEDAINNANVQVFINQVSYTVPTAGTADIPSGTNGSYRFTVKVKKGSLERTTGEKTIVIIATPYPGLTNAQAVAAAKTAVAGGTVNVAYGADQAAKTAAVQSYVNGLLSAVPNAAGVAAVVCHGSGNQYNVALSKGSASDSKSIAMTVNEAADPAIAIVTAAKSAAEGASYNDMTQEAVTSETAIANAVKATAVAAINNGDITVTINKVSYIAPTAGTADTPSGTNGSYIFTVGVEKGSQSQTTTQRAITVTATPYSGLTNAQAVAAAKTAVAGGTVNVAYGVDQAAKTAAVQSYVNGLLSAAPNAVGVAAVVSYGSGNQYNVALSKGSASESKSITMTVNEAAPSGTGGGTGGGTAAPKYEAEVIGGSGSIKAEVTVNTTTGNASAVLSSEQLKNGTTFAVTMPTISGVTNYALGIPVPNLSGTNGNGSITLGTASCSVMLPSNMLTGTQISGEKVQLSIGTVKTDELPGATRTAVGNHPVVSLTLAVDGKPVSWNNPGAPVTVRIPYTPTAEELRNPAGITIYYIDGNGNLTQVPGARYDAKSGAVLFETKHFSYYAVAYAKVQFSDVVPGTWYYDAVSFIAEKGVTTGTSATTFSPDATLTRGQFITMLMRAYKIAPDENPADNFSDAGSSYYTGYLAAAKRLGISNGVGNNSFAPEQAITRQEMFVMLYNALKVLDQLPKGDTGKKLSDFTDAFAAAPYAREAMSYLVKTGVVGGNNGTLDPSTATTRAQIAQVLYRLMGK